MPIRRINSTGRRRILREDVRILVRTAPDGVLEFDARLELAHYELPGEALVFVEAQRQTIFMRFEHGTAACPMPLPGVSYKLTEFPTRDGLLFRVKITSISDPAGVLLAEADKIPFRDEDEKSEPRIPLLPPVPADLDQELWRLEFGGDSGPQLLVNQNVADWKAIVASEAFRSLVFPAAMREVLLHAVLIHQSRDDEDQGDWGCQWLRFAMCLPGVADFPRLTEDRDVDAYEWLSWIDSAVSSFSRQHQLLTNYRSVDPSQ